LLGFDYSDLRAALDSAAGIFLALLARDQVERWRRKRFFARSFRVVDLEDDSQR